MKWNKICLRAALMTLLATAPGSFGRILDKESWAEEPWAKIQDGQRRVGVLLATFDPLTTDYEGLTEELLHVFERIVLVPADFTPTKLTRSPTPLRHKMLLKKYADHERIFVPKVFDFPFPQSRSVVRFLQSQSGDAEIYAILQPEDLESWSKRTVLGMLLPTDQNHLLPAGTISIKSSAIQKAVRLSPDTKPDGLSPEIAKMLQEHGLYKAPVGFLARGKPFLRIGFDALCSYACYFFPSFRPGLSEWSESF